MTEPVSLQVLLMYNQGIGEESMYRIMIIEDDRGIAGAIASQAKLWNLDARPVSDFSNVMSEFAEYSPALCLIDISLPFYDGYYWCMEIRKVSRVPIIFISSKADNMNIVMAMNMGADDFIAKPFDMSVLMAKIMALLRRSYDFSGSSPLIEHRGAILNTGDSSVTIGDRRVEITKNEYRIMLCLMRNKCRVVSREKLMEELWATDSFIDDNTLTVNIGRLRKKLEEAGLERFITTKHGRGYILE